MRLLLVQARSRTTALGLRLAVLVAMLAIVAGATPVAAHADLDATKSSPAPDGLLTAPPDTLDLWFTEPADVGPGSPSVRLFDDEGSEIQIGTPRVDPNDAHHVMVAVDNLEPGTFTVGWSIRSAADGHSLSGAYAFRIGGGRAPGAARVQGETPEPWAVAARWLTFLGIAVVIGGGLFARVVQSGHADPASANDLQREVMVAGSAVALVATIAEPLLQTRWSPAGIPAPGLGDSFASLPDAWWLRLGGVLLLPLALALTSVRLPRWPYAIATEWAMVGVGLVALLGLSLTSHASARESWRDLALSSNILHQWSIALWVGGLAHLAVTWPSRRAATREMIAGGTAAPVAGGAQNAIDPVRRFSRLALGLVAVGVLTGVVNSGLIFPRLASVWDSTYGRVLLIKLLVLTPTLILATLNRNALRRTAKALGNTLIAGRILRLETALALLVVLGGSSLTLWAPPDTRAGNGDLAMVDLAAPVADGTVHLQIQPAIPGKNTMVVKLDTESDIAPTSVRVAFSPLDHAAEPQMVEARPDESGAYAVGGVDLAGEGWWRAEVTLVRPGQPETVIPFYLTLPDPNVNGVAAGPDRDSSDDARAVFERGLTSMTSMHRLRFTQRLTDGKGALFTAETFVSDGADGKPAAWQERGTGFARVIIGNQEWFRQGASPWTERPASSLYLPSEWGDAYTTARGFQLGPEITIDGRVARIITFLTPEVTEPRHQVAAWYAWWVDVETGHVLREAMVSNRHYMIYGFGDFEDPFEITPPIDPNAPATPLARPSNPDGT